jgi:hypothetical protein
VVIGTPAWARNERGIVAVGRVKRHCRQKRLEMEPGLSSLPPSSYLTLSSNRPPPGRRLLHLFCVVRFVGVYIENIIPGIVPQSHRDFRPTNLIGPQLLFGPPFSCSPQFQRLVALFILIFSGYFCQGMVHPACLFLPLGRQRFGHARQKAPPATIATVSMVIKIGLNLKNFPIFILA